MGVPLCLSYFSLCFGLLSYFVLVHVGEGVAGALHWKELVELCKEVGFCGPHLVTARPFVVEPELRARRPLGRDKRMFLFVSSIIGQLKCKGPFNLF